MAKAQEISVLTIGSSSGSLDLLSPILNHDNVNFSIICSNILDYDLPPLVENGARVWYRDELRDTLNVLAPEIYSLPESLKKLLQENDRFHLSEHDLAINNHINLIQQNTGNIEQSYQLLSDETKRENISLFPLVTQNPPILAFKQKKYAPLRFYYEKSELLSESPPEHKDKSKRKYDDKKLTLENFDYIKTMKLNEKSHRALQGSDLVVIIPNDIVSFAFLLKASEIDKQLKKLDSPIVLIWQFKEDREISNEEAEIAGALDYGSTLEDFAPEIANVTDYIIIDKSNKDLVDELRELGCHVLVNDLHENFEKNPQELLDSVFSIGNIAETAEQSQKSKKIPMEDVPEEKEDLEDSTSESKTDKDIKEKKTKTISQLLESPEEAGSEKIKEKSSENDESEEEIEDTEVKPKPEKKSKKSKKKPAEQNIEESDSDEESLEEDLVEKTQNTFAIEEEEEWIDTVARGIQLIFHDNNSDALMWLSDQSKLDTDNEVQIAGEVLKSWVDSKSNVERRKGAEIISSLAKGRRDTYLQIMQRQMVSSVLESNEDRRRRLIQIFNMLHEVDGSLAEALIKEITKNMAMPANDEPAILERSKISIVQLVIHSRRLTKVSINELLNIQDRDNPPAAQIWNILTTFDAGMVAIELVTNFSSAKASEIIRKANFLRFTGSVYTILQEVLKAWESGDINAIAETTGAIIPEETLRKFERLELARKVQKLKMVQLSALAESLNKDVETVERLVTELIVNDELKAEMKLVEDKMYLVANGEESNSNN
ncbi:MAG: hypothetical protein GPJ54_14940 [Candidatus Heimdallarchaeota archaeon]|nr:hypothetical protein [Candidatus Heimdallarchaeota archaeon]